MTSFLLFACTFEDQGKKYHEVAVKMILVCLIAFNIIYYMAITAQILYTKEYAGVIYARYSDARLKAHFNRIKQLLDQCASKYTQFNLDEVSHLYEHNEVQKQAPIFVTLQYVHIVVLFLFIVSTVLFQMLTMFHYNDVYSKVTAVDTFSDGRSAESPGLELDGRRVSSGSDGEKRRQPEDGQNQIELVEVQTASENEIEGVQQLDSSPVGEFEAAEV